MMKKNDPGHLFNPARQSPIAIAIILIKFIKNLVRAIWPILIIWVLRRESASNDNYFSIAVIVISSLTVIFSIVAYFKYYYYVKGQDLIIEKGLLYKKKILIPADRIQSINFEQQIIHQAFDVVAVKIDTAGSAQNEISLDALNKHVAEDLKEYLLSQKNETSWTQKEFPTQESLATKEPKKQHLKLGITDLVKIGVSQNHLQTAGIIIAFGIGFLDDIEEALNIDFIQQIQDYLGIFHLSNLMSLLIIIPVLAIIAFLITLIRTILNYFDFTLWSDSKGFTSTAGLFTKKEKFVNLQKIQMVSWSQNPLEKLFNLFDMSLKQASSIEVGSKQSMRIPGVYISELEQIKSHSIPNSLFQNQDEFGIDKSIIFRTILYFGILPLIPIGLTLYTKFNLTTAIIGSIVLLALVIFISIRYHRKWKIKISPTGVIAARGVYGITYTAVQFLKVQEISINQNLHQHRKDLATLSISTASGSLDLPYIPLHVAKQLNDYILSYVEQGKGQWM